MSTYTNIYDKTVNNGHTVISTRNTEPKLYKSFKSLTIGLRIITCWINYRTINLKRDTHTNTQ